MRRGARPRGSALKTTGATAGGHLAEDRGATLFAARRLVAPALLPSALWGAVLTHRVAACRSVDFGCYKICSPEGGGAFARSNATESPIRWWAAVDTVRLSGPQLCLNNPTEPPGFVS